MKNAPQYRQIAALLQKPIDSGTLQAGDKLPSVRHIAREYQVSSMTALQAIRWLEQQGKITAQARSGYFVAAKKQATEQTEPLAFVQLSRDENLHLSLVGQPCRVRLDLANASLDLYPTDRLSIIMRQLIYQHPDLLGAPVHGMGYEPLRQQIARRALDYGCALDLQEIMITNGCIEALSLAIQAVTSVGDCVVVESPTYFVILQMLQQLGRTVIEIPTNAQGIDLSCLADVMQRQKIHAIVTIPNANNPRGSTPDDAHKQQLLTLAEQHQCIVIEDDIYGDLSYLPQRPRPLRAFSDHVILCSGFSKTLAPGFRIGWVAAGKHTSKLNALKYTSTMGTAVYPQATIAEFLRTGRYDVHLKKLRKSLASQISAIRQTILNSFPEGTSVSQPAGGFVLWIELPAYQMTTQRLFQKARDEGIGIAPGVLFASDERFSHAFRLNAGAGWNETIRDAILRLAEILKE